MIQDQIQKKTNSSATTIDRRSNISHKELLKEYIEPHIPVILTDATNKWSAMGKLTPEFFKTKYGHLTKEIKGVTYTLAEVVDLILASSPESPAPYPCNLNVEKYFPELLKEFSPQIVSGKMDRINHPLLPRFMTSGTEVYEIFLGGRGAAFPYLHYDALFMHTQITQLYGSKDFFMFGPDQTKYMYPREDYPKASPINFFNPDYEKYPLFKHATPIKITVQEGETLLFPSGWWHTTQINEPCITFGRAQLNASNWKLYLDDEYQMLKKHSPRRAFPAYVYGKVLGQIMNLQEKFI